MAPGFRILNRTRSVDARLVERFRSIPVANVSDTMSRMSAGGARLRPMHASGAMAGPALTVKTRPGDNLMIHKAIDLAVPGDVIVIDGGGDLTNSLMGEIMLSLAIKESIAGFVVDGAIRDADAFVEINLPGDLMLGDGDGTLCVPFAEAENTCSAAEAKNAAEQVQMAEIGAGTLDRSWIDETLNRLGCEFP